MNLCEPSCTALACEVAETPHESHQVFHRNMLPPELQSYLPMRRFALASRAVLSCQQAEILEAQPLIAYGSGMLQYRALLVCTVFVDTAKEAACDMLDSS